MKFYKLGSENRNKPDNSFNTVGASGNLMIYICRYTFNEQCYGFLQSMWTNHRI